MIRKVTVNDVNDINALGQNLHKNFTSVFHIETEINKDDTIILVVESNGIISGYLYALKLMDNIDLLSIYVSAEYRNNNLGYALLNNLQEEAIDKEILLEVSTKNIAAMNLYKKVGFTKIGIRKNYYDDSDAIVMRWKNEK